MITEHRRWLEDKRIGDFVTLRVKLENENVSIRSTILIESQ